MNKTVEALLQWRSLEEGGRERPPPGPTYSTVARFHHQDPADWLREAWSLVIEFLEQPDATRSHRVRVRFLFDGPEDWLTAGSKFDMMEGRKCVATGCVLP